MFIGSVSITKEVDKFSDMKKKNGNMRKQSGNSKVEELPVKQVAWNLQNINVMEEKQKARD